MRMINSLTKKHKIVVLITHLCYFHQKKLIWTVANEAFWVQLYLIKVI